MFVSVWKEVGIGVVVADFSILDGADATGFLIFVIVKDFVACEPDARR